MTQNIEISEKVGLLRSFQREEGRVPSYAELAELWGYRSKSAVAYAVQRLIELGYLRKGEKGRLAFTEKIAGSIPVLGSVQAGFPSPAEEELLDTLSLDEYLVRRPEATYVLSVEGDSMIEAGIQPGDMVLVEKGGTPKPGSIVIAQVDGEWTIKYFGRDEEGVYLDPANPTYSRIRPLQSLSIGGLVVGVMRKY